MGAWCHNSHIYASIIIGVMFMMKEMGEYDEDEIEPGKDPATDWT